MLIFNALAQRRGINLPGIGSLYVISVAARMQDDGKLTPPTSRVLFAPEEVQGYDDILRLIGESSGRDEPRCREIYDTWLSGVRTEEGVHIFSVGDIVGGTFTPSEELQRTLNPSGTSFVQLKRQFTPRQIFFWVAVTVVVGGGLAAGLITYLNSQPGEYDAPYAEGTPLTAPASPDSPAMARTAGSDTEATLEALTESDMEAQPAADKPAAQPQAAPEPAKPLPAEAEPAARPKPSEQAKPSEAAKPATTPAQTPANKPTAAPTPPAKANTSIPASQAPRSGEMRYYVVVGTYSTDENAERFIASAKKKDASQTYRKLPLSNGKIMVYTADTASDAEAQQQRRALSGSFPDAWVFKRRAR